MIETIQFHGREVVAPILGNGRELVEDLEAYFQDEHFMEWFNLDEQTRKEFIRDRDDWKCLICGREEVEVHEIISKGASTAAQALVAWNMITVCREHHDLLQRHVWKIYHFDPLDLKGGLIVFDAGARRVPDEDLWFFNRPDPQMAEICHEDYRWLKAWALHRRAQDWEAAVRIARLRENKGYTHLGEASHRSMLSGALLDTAYAETLETAIGLANRYGVSERLVVSEKDSKGDEVLASAIDARWARQLLEAVDEGKIEQVGLARYLIDISGMSSLDYNRWYRGEIKGCKEKKRLGINVGEDKLYQYTVDPDDPEPSYDMIVEGKAVKGEVVEG